MFFGFGAFAADVVEEHGKGANAELIHLLEFIGDVLVIFGSPADAAAGVDGPDEIDFILFGDGGELFDLFGLRLWVGFAPLGAVEGVVFGAVDVGVELVEAVEFELGDAFFVRPRVSVESLDGASEGDFGEVVDGDFRDVGGVAVGVEKLAEGLNGVKLSGGIGADDEDAFVLDDNLVGAGEFGVREGVGLNGWVGGEGEDEVLNGAVWVGGGEKGLELGDGVGIGFGGGRDFGVGRYGDFLISLDRDLLGLGVEFERVGREREREGEEGSKGTEE